MAEGRRGARRRIAMLERTQFALELRKTAMSYRDIATSMIDEFGDRLPPSYDYRMAWSDVQRGLDMLKTDLTDLAENVLTLELERLDQLQSTLWNDAMGTGPQKYQAIRASLEIHDRRARLLRLTEMQPMVFAPHMNVTEVIVRKSEDPQIPILEYDELVEMMHKAELEAKERAMIGAADEGE